MVVNKSDLAAAVADKLNIPLKRSEAAVDGVFASMTAALARGERIEIRGFGVWTARQYPARTGRNPKTGAAISVPPKRLPFFKTGKQLADLIMAAWQRGQSQPGSQDPGPIGPQAPQID